jgi:hypothetical protein
VAVRALGAVVQFGQAKTIDEIRVPLSQKVMDASPLVRKALYTVPRRDGPRALNIPSPLCL